MNPVNHNMLRRCLNWDYCAPCIYQITITLAQRGGDTLGRIIVDERDSTGLPLAAHCEPTPFGQAIAKHWAAFPRYNPEIKPLWLQLMPDHLHGILWVQRRMKRPLGNAIGGFKHGSVLEAGPVLEAPASRSPVLEAGASRSPFLEAGASSTGPSLNPPGLRREHRTSPFSPGFQDTILFHRGQLQNMINYLRDNPRRLAVKRFCPSLFKSARELCVELYPGCQGRFSAIGNDALLRRELIQVQCSRSLFSYRRAPKAGGYGLAIARDASGAPLIDRSTADFAAKRDSLLAAARHGAVLISPCVSDGEREIAREALTAKLPLITLQNKGFAKLQKPAGRYFDACAEGRLLMLAPINWPYQPGEKPMTRRDATALNRLAQWLAGPGAAEINYHGIRPLDIDEWALGSVL